MADTQNNSDVPALSGLIPPMITPLTTEGALDESAIERLVSYMLANGVDGLFLMGSSGEGPWLTFQQQRQLIRRVQQVVDGRVPLLVGALEPGTQRTLEAVRMYEDTGADVLVITSPYYFAADQAAQLRHFETIAAQTSLPIMLYNIPQTTHNLVTPDTVRRLLAVEHIIGIKDSATHWEAFSQFLELKTLKPGFVVFQGSEKLALRSLLAGGDGLVAGMGNLIPALLKRLITSLQTGDRDIAQHLQEQITALWDLHTYDYWLVCLKYAASLLGFGSGATCGHVNQISAESKAIIRDMLRAHVPDQVIA